MSYPMRFCKKCEGTPEVKTDHETGMHWCECYDCGYYELPKHHTIIAAISDWNRIQLIGDDENMLCLECEKRIEHCQCKNES